MYLELTVEEVVEGVWSTGVYSLANTTVIEGENGLIVCDTGDTREEADHIREAMEKISDRPIKVIIYSHSHDALGGGALVDAPEDVLVIGLCLVIIDPAGVEQPREARSVDETRFEA